MDTYKVIKRAMKTYKINITTKRSAFLKEVARAFSAMCEMKARKNKRITAMYFGDLKKAIPDVEIYIDELAHFLAPDVIAYYMTRALIHENCHAEGFNEKQAYAASKEIMKLMKPMVWELVVCPKTGTNINWGECLRCTDSEKHAECPILPIREFAREREYQPNVYHVTELTHPRHSCD